MRCTALVLYVLLRHKMYPWRCLFRGAPIFMIAADIVAQLGFSLSLQIVAFHVCRNETDDVDWVAIHARDENDALRKFISTHVDHDKLTIIVIGAFLSALRAFVSQKAEVH